MKAILIAVSVLLVAAVAHLNAATEKTKEIPVGRYQISCATNSAYLIWKCWRVDTASGIVEKVISE